MSRLFVVCILLYCSLLTACGSSPTSVAETTSTIELSPLPTQTPWIIVVTATPLPTPTYPPLPVDLPTIPPLSERSQDAVPAGVEANGYIAKYTAKVYMGPDEMNGIIKTLWMGDPIYVVDTMGSLGWVRVLFADGKSGWLRAQVSDIQLDNEYEAYPTIETNTMMTLFDMPTYTPDELKTIRPAPTPTQPPTRTLAPTRTPTTFVATPTPQLIPTVPVAPPPGWQLNTPTPNIDITQMRGVVLAPQLNIRTGPGTNYPSWGSLEAGHSLFILGRADGLPWVIVAFSDLSHGWIAASPDLIQLQRPIESYPVVPYEPAPGCDPAYPSICIYYGSYDLDCPDINEANFPVLPPDPHRLDGDGDGRGCEWN